MTARPNASEAGIELVRGFVNTVEFEAGTDDLATVAGARDWMQNRGLLGDEPITASQRLRFVEVREALRGLIAAGHGGVVASDVLAVLDGAGRAARFALQFSPDGSADLSPDAAGADLALGRILAAAYRAMLDGSWDRLKTCDNDECRWAFYDRSKNRSGRWCSMEGCGNRMKARAYRARHGDRR